MKQISVLTENGITGTIMASDDAIIGKELLVTYHDENGFTKHEKHTILEILAELDLY